MGPRRAYFNYRNTVPSKVHQFKARFLNLGIIDNFYLIIPCCRWCPVLCKIFISIFGFHPLHARRNPPISLPVVTPKISLDFATCPPENKIAPDWETLIKVCLGGWFSIIAGYCPWAGISPVSLAFWVVVECSMVSGWIRWVP